MTMLKTSMATLLGTLICSLGLSGTAKAIQISLGGSDYEITTTTGIYNNLRPTLSTNPWFSSASAATNAKQQAPLSNNIFYAFEDFTSIQGYGVGYSVRNRTLFNRQLFDPDYFTSTNTFAIATLIPPTPETVPEPASIVGLLAVGTVAMGALTRRKKESTT